MTQDDTGDLKPQPKACTHFRPAFEAASRSQPQLQCLLQVLNGDAPTQVAKLLSKGAGAWLLPAGSTPG